VTKKKAEKADSGAGTDDLDALFQLPLGEFTAARKALAARLKKSGHATKADHVKALQKPPLSAWAVNQLYWRHRAAFDRLLDAGQQFRTAQTAQLAGRSADLRGPLEARREALADLSRRAADVLRDAGHSPNPDVMRRITTTLEALSTYGGLPDTPQAGRLADDVDPPGFESLAALVPRIGKEAMTGPSRVLPFQQEAAKKKKKEPARKLDPREAERAREEERQTARATAKAALQASERALREARKQAEQAEAALKKAAARAKETEKEAREIEKEKAAVDRRYEKASSDADGARQEARHVAEQAEAAAQALEDAELDVEKANRALKALD
jgi:DNA repair exonuclease SbcCD ATPase subunit